MRRATVLLIEPSCLLAVVVAVVAVEVAYIPAQPREPWEPSANSPDKLEGPRTTGNEAWSSHANNLSQLTTCYNFPLIFFY